MAGSRAYRANGPRRPRGVVVGNPARRMSSSRQCRGAAAGAYRSARAGVGAHRARHGRMENKSPRLGQRNRQRSPLYFAAIVRSPPGEGLSPTCPARRGRPARPAKRRVRAANLGAYHRWDAGANWPRPGKTAKRLENCYAPPCRRHTRQRFALRQDLAIRRRPYRERNRTRLAAFRARTACCTELSYTPVATPRSLPGELCPPKFKAGLASTAYAGAARAAPGRRARR